jgi:hypothetical protein
MINKEERKLERRKLVDEIDILLPFSCLRTIDLASRGISLTSIKNNSCSLEKLKIARDLLFDHAVQKISSNPTKKNVLEELIKDGNVRLRGLPFPSI